MTKQIEINLPDWFELDGLNTLDTIISPNSEDVGILVAGENLDYTKTCCPTVRLYLLQLVDGKYEVTKELEAFPFQSTDEAIQFSSKLPQLNAFDLVMLLNKEQPIFTA
ncbi:geranylgeranyl pyrophosphate synthase [Lysinibacillus sp. KU-BSD001]|uniref:geranylgeranyl pyrophosphate synthase n=1 Tax=Lysinibacillus sp. KU-BSD001 TaxID=3141328 RepID=UPI0036EAF79A